MPQEPEELPIRLAFEGPASAVLLAIFGERR